MSMVNGCLEGLGERSLQRKLVPKLSRVRRGPLALFWMALLSLALFGFGHDEAWANSARVPGPYVARPLALPSGTLRIDAGHHWPFNDALFKHTVIRGAPDQQYLNPGLTFGATNDFEVGLVAPIRLSPGLHIEDPRVHALFQFARGPLDAGVFGSFRLGFFDRWVLTTGVPLYWHIQPNLRLDFGGFLEFEFGDTSAVAIIAPAQLVIQLHPDWFAGPETGFVAYRLFDDGGGVAIPLGGFVGYTIRPGGTTLGDLYARTRIDNLVNGFDSVSLMFGLEFFFNL
jgi:hypothetical protein